MHKREGKREEEKEVESEEASEYRYCKWHSNQISEISKTEGVRSINDTTDHLCQLDAQFNIVLVSRQHEHRATQVSRLLHVALSFVCKSERECGINANKRSADTPSDAA